MIHYKNVKPIHPLLHHYIESYTQLTGHQAIAAKLIMPQVGNTLFFDFGGQMITNQGNWNVGLATFSPQAYQATFQADKTDRLLVRFTAYGLSRFMTQPLSELNKPIMPIEAIWGSAAYRLYQRLGQLTRVEQRVAELEAFLLSHLCLPTAIEQAMFSFADSYRLSVDKPSLAIMLRQLPLSLRQVERKFKSFTGVDPQTYQRLCRFERARTLLSLHPRTSLITIAHEAGYYDQAHFSNEFKRLTGTRPKQFTLCDL